MLLKVLPSELQATFWFHYFTTILSSDLNLNCPNVIIMAFLAIFDPLGLKKFHINKDTMLDLTLLPIELLIYV
jgi:hypothetical protein